jgi:hypothetical protein
MIPVLLLSLLVLGGNGDARTPPALIVSGVVVRPDTGGGYTAIVSVEVRDGFHIQADSVVDEFLIPTRVVLAGNTGFELGPVVFPAEREFTMEGVGVPWRVFDGSFDILVGLRSLGEPPAGKVSTVGAELKYQACDRRQCYPPRTVEFEIPVEKR